MSYNIIDILQDAPENFVIRDALCRCFEVIETHKNIVCFVSGGGDSDVVVDMLIRCGGKDITDFVFINTGLEYEATISHLLYLEEKYGIIIHKIRATKSIPSCVNEYGVPFWSKYASEMIYRLQLHDFQWEDESYDVLLKKYPKCKTALRWWCNIGKGTTMFTINRAPFLKEFMISNPPEFKISNRCCEETKKKSSAKFQKGKGYDLCCVGVRKDEGGIRVAHKSCFSEQDITDQFRPVFWLRDKDKEEYCDHYNITHSRCYTQYGLQRTGCFGCPFGKRFEDELTKIEKYEPRLLKAANNIFGQSYEYTRKYLAFREEMKLRKMLHHEEDVCENSQ